MSFPSRPRAVVTGAASGFGRAISLRLAARGARLVISDLDEVGLAETRDQAKYLGAEVRTSRCDVRDPKDVEAQALLADEAFGGTDILVNNAGVAVAGDVGDVPLEDWRWQIEINLFGVIYGCHYFVPRMKKAGSGFILNVASAAGLLSAPKMGPYNVTKAGVVALSETLYGEVGHQGIHVSALCPTFFRTNIHDSARSSDPKLKAQTERLVSKSKWSAEDIADIALTGLESGALYIIPQADGKMMWRTKRALGHRFYGMLGKAMTDKRFQRVLGFKSE